MRAMVITQDFTYLARHGTTNVICLISEKEAKK